MASARKPAPVSFYTAWKAEWPKIAGGLTTAFILFLASLAFAPVRHWLLPPKDRDYPLFCTAEQVADLSTARMIVRFYIVNRADEPLTDETLGARLAEIDRRTGGQSTPVITLRLWREDGKIVAPSADRDFNGDKGEVMVRPIARGTAISIRRIEPRAILRVTIPVAELPDLRPTPLSARAGIPLSVSDYADACYGRT